ncbi:hypothetical protein ARMGADRAFT_84933 [Armillaria gallica]|uniref:Uncharacterized protein n=1 Tax=Armillaria gallica TaxID=47427 RepID=A0A2H3CAS5_ARMGA|nr:hypothetical protein ARMGADRAFT_84933 [Armillaria gallica]
MERYIQLCHNCRQRFDTQAPTLTLDTALYLRHWGQLNDSEAEFCTNAIVDLQKKISEYEAEISRLNTTLETLKTGRRSLTSCKAKYESFLAPVRRLPRDVLQDIFELLCTSVSHDAFLSRNDLPLVSTTPFYLSSVCAYWRDICLSSPMLWTSVLASIDYRGASIPFLYITKLFKQRSGVRLLNLQMSVELGGVGKGFNHNDVQRRLQYAVNSVFYSPDTLNLLGLKRIGIDSRTVALWNVLRKDIYPEFPELEHLEFAGDVEFSWEHPIKVFEHAPKLCTLALNAFRGTFFSLPSKQITTIYFANVLSFVYPSRLYNFPNARTATFDGCPDLLFGIAEIPFQRLVLKDSLPSFHRAGSMPHLKALELVDIDCTMSSEFDDRMNTICALSKYVLKSPLTELALTTLTVGPPEMLSLLHAVPQLRRLSIVEQTDACVRIVSPQFIRQLGNLEMLPKLEHLQLVWSGEVDEGSVLDMLEQRALKSAVNPEGRRAQTGHHVSRRHSSWAWYTSSALVEKTHRHHNCFLLNPSQK